MKPVCEKCAQEGGGGVEGWDLGPTLILFVLWASANFGCGLVCLFVCLSLLIVVSQTGGIAFFCT